ncbi:transposase [Hexamita inflata]|uniref:Transposase n=1 Tax=Hexamita inflata TaxID=28002 RepID=A0AA86NF69_9EUKA|nr:transposase [Hexamita inflata]
MDKQQRSSLIKDFVMKMSIQEFITYAQDRQWIPTVFKCEICHNFCAQQKNKLSYIWYCKQCPKQYSILYGTYFYNSKFDIRLLSLIAIFCVSELTVHQVARLLPVSERNIYGYFHQIRQAIIASQLVQLLEGEVEIDESLFARHKYHVGRHRKTMQIWVLGLKQRDSDACRFFVVGNTRTEAVLLPLIKSCVKNQSVIYSDKWRAYFNLQSHNSYVHYTVNHSIQFVNRALMPQNILIHTQGIESTWNAAKMHFRMMRGCHKENIQEYLNYYSVLKQKHRNVEDLLDIGLNFNNYYYEDVTQDIVTNQTQ